MDGQAALALIRDVGVWKLGDFDGCLCGHFVVKGVEVDIACRKSSGSHGRTTMLRVHSESLDASIEELVPIADEVRRQIGEGDGTPIATRYCDWLKDKNNACCWCGKPRADADAYLCVACEKKPEATKRYSVQRAMIDAALEEKS